jgi:Host cell surface-exposed lipoprotein
MPRISRCPSASVTNTATGTTSRTCDEARRTAARLGVSLRIISELNAKRSAESYIEMSGFSRSGLIEQLKFEGFSAKDAEVAIDSMKVNWNEEADQSAKSYVDMSGFSRSGLIEQLIFEGYTKTQAAHGADSVGL